MRLPAGWLLTLSLLICSAEAGIFDFIFGGPKKPPQAKVRKSGLPDAFIKAFEARQPVDNHEWKSPPSGAARGPCPALNTLANHGYLRRDGKNITLAQVIDASFNAWLLLPDMTGLITARGIANSNHGLDHQFNLTITGHPSWRMEHDCSFSRLDRKEGNPIPFNQNVWFSSLFDLFGGSVFRLLTFQSTLITPRLLAKAKAARLRDIFKRCDYSGLAAAEGALEIGMVISALQENNKGAAKLSYVRGLFEQEKIVNDDDDDKGVEQNVFVGGISGTLKLAQDALQSSTTLQKTTDAGQITTIADILKILQPTNPQVVLQLRSLIVDDLGYPASMVESLDKLVTEREPQPPAFAPQPFFPPPPPPPGFRPTAFPPRAFQQRGRQ